MFLVNIVYFVLAALIIQLIFGVRFIEYVYFSRPIFNIDSFSEVLKIRKEIFLKIRKKIVIINLLVSAFFFSGYYLMFNDLFDSYFKGHQDELSQSILSSYDRKDIGIYQSFNLKKSEDPLGMIVNLPNGEKYFVEEDFIFGNLSEETPYLKLSYLTISKDKLEDIVSSEDSYLKELKELKKKPLFNFLFGKTFDKYLKPAENIGQNYYQVEAIGTLTEEEKDFVSEIINDLKNQP